MRGKLKEQIRKSCTTWLFLLFELCAALCASEGLAKTSRLAPSRDPLTARLPPPDPAMARLGSNSKALERRGTKCGERGGGGEDGNSGDIFFGKDGSRSWLGILEQVALGYRVG